MGLANRVRAFWPATHLNGGSQRVSTHPPNSWVRQMTEKLFGGVMTKGRLTISSVTRSTTAIANYPEGIPFVSVVIPCRNEEKHISACLESIVANEYPIDRIEILVVDGVCSDRTAAIVADFVRRYPFIHLIENPRQTIPAAMNIGFQNGRGDIILKADAHSTYPVDYISKCVRALREHGADNVGGTVELKPGAETLIGKTIAFALAHPFGSGNAHVKTGSKKPRWADTAAFGCFPREVFEKVGPWNENLAGSSDMDFNSRIRAAGGRILLVPDIRICYSADPDLASFWRHNFADGVWVTYVNKFGSRAWAWRHWVPLMFVGTVLFLALFAIFSSFFAWLLLGCVGTYLALSLAAGIQSALSAGDLRFAITLPLVFFLRHVAHGLGALYGSFLLFLPGIRWKGRREAAT